MVSNVQHWAISVFGKVHMDVLREEWSPAFTVSKLAVAVQSLLSEEAPT